MKPDVEAVCHFPVTVRITGALTGPQLDELAASVERAVAGRIADAHRQLGVRPGHRAVTAAGARAARLAPPADHPGTRPASQGRWPRPSAGPASPTASGRPAGDPHAVGTLLRLQAVYGAPVVGAALAPSGNRRIAAPRPGLYKVGFIDNSDGARIRTAPQELDGQPLRAAPLPPATQIFITGTHPVLPAWWYVTAFAPVPGAAPDQLELLRGYMLSTFITTDLPEPLARLHQIVAGDTVERLAVAMFKDAVRPGHDLRFYENVLLFVNQAKHRAGISGSYQDPGLLGGGVGNIQLFAGHRIWLVSPAYARALEPLVPSGSLTGGLVAVVKGAGQRFGDIVASVAQSDRYLGEVAGQYAQTIRDNLPEIIGVVAGFLAAELTSAVLAATPGGQLPAAFIQLVLAAYGAAGAAQAGADAVTHAAQWLSLAWTAAGDPKQIEAASKEFLRMLVSIALAALSYLAAQGSLTRAVEIASSLPPATLQAVAATGGQAVTAAPPVEGPAAPAGRAGAVGGAKTEVRQKSAGPEKAEGQPAPGGGAQPPASDDDVNPAQATRPDVKGGQQPTIDNRRVPVQRTRRVDLGDFVLLPGEATQRAALARIRRLIGRKVSDTPLGPLWEQARRDATGGRSLENASRQEMLGLYDKVRNRFWDLARKDNGPAARFLKDTGFEFGKGRAPLLRVNKADIPVQERRISLDHNLEKALGDNYKKAVDATNLTFEFHNPNSSRETIQVKFGLRATEAGPE